MVKVYFFNLWHEWRGKTYYDKLVHVFHVMVLRGLTIRGKADIIEIHLKFMNYEMVVCIYPNGTKEI